MRRQIWLTFLLLTAFLIILDVSNTIAQKDWVPSYLQLSSLIHKRAPESNSIVGVCNSMDPAMNTLAAPVNSALSYAQVDSITRLSVTRAGGLQNIIQPGDWVVIKPNLLVVPGVTSGSYSWAHNGVTTDLRVIKSIIQQLVEEGDASRISVAEGAPWRKNGDPLAPGQTVDGWTYHWPWFDNLSIEDMIAEFNTSHPDITFDYIDLNYPPYTLTPVPGGGLSQDSYYVPDAILNCDKLIAVAAMKTHNLTRVTLTNKLYVGISPASVYRSGAFDHMGIPHYTVNGVPNAIERTLVDLMSYHPPDFGVVECFWGTEGNGPLGGSAIQRNLVIAGHDPVAVDAVSAYSMGMNPWDIDHLHWSHSKGFGTNDLQYINTVGPDLSSIRYNFARAKAQGRANRVWLINGTFAGTDLNTDMLAGQEAAINPSEGQVTNGKTWTSFTDIDDFMDLAKAYSYPSSCISYAFTRIYADVQKTVRLRFGVDDGIKVWLNGSIIYTSSSSESYALVAHDLPITLNPGENRLLIKTRNTSGTYGFGVCVSESSGDTPLGITYNIQSPGAPSISLNSPIDGATTTSPSMTLSASVSDPDGDSVIVKFYGDTAAAASELLFAQKVASGTTVTYPWKARTLEPTTGTYGLWHFDESSGSLLNDATGRGHNGSWHCDSTLRKMWTSNGAFGYALDFFGYHTGTLENPCGADFVEVPDDPDLDVDPSGQLTMEFWIKPDCLPPVSGYSCDTARYWGIFTKRIPCVPPQDTVSGCGSWANYCIFYNYPTQTIGFYGNANLYQSTCSLTVGQWQYIAVTIDGTTHDLRFYKNGVLKTATTGSIGNTVDGPIRIGASAYRRKGVDGQIDELRLSRRILGAQEIADNYKLATGTYYWKVVASDGIESSTSDTRSFSVTDEGPDNTPPVITLNSPPADSSTTNTHMNLDFDVSDENPMTVSIYGDMNTGPTTLLSVRRNASSGNILYDWTALPLSSEPSNTMGLWHFNDGTGTSLSDASGNTNNGSFSGAPAWSDAGRFGYALDFDGTDDYVNIPDASSLDIDSASGAMTIEAWLYPHTSAGGKYRSIISKKAMGGSIVNYQISLDQTTGNLLFYSGHWPQIWISSVSIPTNQWSYVAVTLTASEGRLRFFRNGVLLDSTVTYSGNGGCFGAANSTVLTIGTAGVVSECFDGLIDDVRLTRRSLTRTEIADNYRLKTGSHYWYVSALDSASNSSNSETRRFGIGVEYAPDIPSLITPADLANVTNSKPTFVWSSTAGPVGTYTIQYSTDINFVTGVTTVSGLVDTFYTAASSLTSGVWYWHVQAVNGAGSSGYQATPFSFTLAVDETPPGITLNAPTEGAITPNAYADLDFNVSDDNPMTVYVYGDTTPSATDLLYIQQNVSSGNMVYSWSAPVLKPEAGVTGGLWHLDEGTGVTFADASGNGNNGSFVTPPLWAAGRFGNSLNFDGTDDYVSVPDAGSLDVDSATGLITLEAWIYPHTSGGGIYRSFLAKRALGATSGPCNYQLSLNNTNGNLLFYNGNTTTGIYISSVSVPLNQWSYVAVTLSATEGRLRFYRNGVLLDSSITGATFGAANSEALYLGLAARVAECFDGLVDEVRITKRILSSLEIANNYKLKNGTYHWRVRADDSYANSTTSEIRSFIVGPDNVPPVITLNAPADGINTTNSYMNLDFNLTDANPMNVWIYGDTASAADLLYVNTNVSSGNIIYNWTAPVLKPKAGETMGLWHFNDGTGTVLSDGSGNGNNGSFSSAPVWSTAGRFGYTLDFDGTNDYISIPDASSLDISNTTGAITMECWIYPHVSAGNIWRSIISKKDIGGSLVNYQISLHRDDGTLLFYNGTFPAGLYKSSVTVPLNQWSYIAVTLAASEGRLRFYRNGQPLDSISGASFGPPNTAILTIGTAGAIAECFDGMIDEVRLTNRVLSSTEIADNYKLKDGTYHWKVTATDSYANSNTSETRYFTVGTAIPPEIPTLISPANTALINDNTPTFSWSSTAGPGGTYTLEYARDAAFTSGKVIESGITVATFTPSVVLGEGTWYWHVQAHNTGGSSGYQVTPFSFTIDTQAPGVPALLSPAQNSYTNDNTPDFSWSSTAGGGGAYTLQYSPDANFISNVTTVADLANAFYTPAAALADGVWHWRVKARDLANNESAYSIPWSLTIDIAPPPAPSNFVIQPGHEKCKLSWTKPTSGGLAGVMIRRNPWATGAYPEYDDTYPSPLGYPAGPAAGELIYQGMAESFMDSSSLLIMPRNIYYYSIFSYDTAGNYSTVGSAQQGRATNYWLGDRSGDGSVYFEDLPLFSNAFWTSPGNGNYDPQFDIGPTDNHSPKGLPLTDNIINFEDLVIFALNYGVVGPNQKTVPLFADQSVSGPLGLSLTNDAEATRAGEEFTVRVHLQNNPGTVKAIHFVIPFDPSQVQLVGVDRNDKLKDTPASLFFDGRERDQQVDVSIALLGGGAAIGGSGELGQITFRLLRSGPLSLSFGLIDIRDGKNCPLEAADLTGHEVVPDLIPTHYGLSQNYPNPFNLQTEILYQLPQSGEVTLKIYNIQGRLVRILLSGSLSAGYYRTIWDGCDDFGNPVSTGIYLSHLMAGNFNATRKMVLLK